MLIKHLGRPDAFCPLAYDTTERLDWTFLGKIDQGPLAYDRYPAHKRR